MATQRSALGLRNVKFFLHGGVGDVQGNKCLPAKLKSGCRIEYCRSENPDRILNYYAFGPDPKSFSLGYSS